MSPATLSKPKKSQTPTTQPSAPKYTIIVFLLILLAISRYLYLSADFPAGLGVEGTLYTDEGWWARNSVNWIREGNWYIDDGYNPIVNLPAFSLIQTVWLKVFGISLSSARALSATCTVGIGVIVFLLVRSELNARLAWIAPLIVLSSHSTFAFSRLALLEMPMVFLILISLSLLTKLDHHEVQHSSIQAPPRTKATDTFILLASAAALLAAVLTKTTALFAFPIALHLLVVRSQRSSVKVRQLLIWLLFFGLGYSLYYLTFVYGQASNASYFSDYNLEGKLIYKGILDFLEGPPRVVLRSFRIFPILFPCLLWATAVLIQNKVYRRSRLCQIAMLWSFLSLTMFAISNYAPPRYFVILIVPISISITLALQSMTPTKNNKTKDNKIASGMHRFRKLATKLAMDKQFFQATVATAVIVSLLRTGLYLRAPEFSLLNMAVDISEQVKAQPVGDRIVMGKFADTLALATPIKGINDKMGFRPIPYRLETFRPGYYVYLGSVNEDGFVADNDYSVPKKVQEYYQLQLIDTFDVFQNRVYDRPVFFYRMLPKS